MSEKWSMAAITSLACLATSALYHGAFHFSQGKFCTKIRLKLRTEPIPLVNLENIPYITNNIALDRINEGFEYKYGGIQVLYAPSGSGKTTYLTKAAVQYQKDKKHVVFISCAANKKHLYDCLGIPNLSFRLSEVIPDKTVVILDQMESAVFGEELKSMLREIALDSRKHRNYVVIVSVSDQEVVQKILTLNGNDKFRQLGSAIDYRWTRDLVCAYVQQSLQYVTWSDFDKAELVELATKAGTPGFLFYLEELKNPTPAILKNKAIRVKADKYAAAWDIVDDDNVVE